MNYRINYTLEKIYIYFYISSNFLFKIMQNRFHRSYRSTSLYIDSWSMTFTGWKFPIAPKRNRIIRPYFERYRSMNHHLHLCIVTAGGIMSDQ